MTECERIIKQGVLPESFFKEEFICGYLVTEERKKIWAIELDLLLELDRVCKKHSLKYMLSGGSLLGAVRHKGFIPWDDDIDVMMIREDYEYLMQLNYEFSTPYFLQTPYTDDGYFFSYNKLRNINTSSVSRIFEYQHFCQGIAIDIFPLDYYCSNGMRNKYNRLKELMLDLGTYMRMLNPELDEMNKKRVINYSGRDPWMTYQKILDIYSEDKNKQCDCIGLLACTSYDVEKLSYDINDLRNTIYWDFCGYSVPIPQKYDKILRTQYGDYNILPPIEERGQWHTGVIFDSEKPYTYYLKDNKNNLG